MRNVEIVKPSNFIAHSMPEELLQEDRGEARKAQARRVKDRVLGKTLAINRQQIAIEMTLDLVTANLESLSKALMEEAQATSKDAHIFDVLNLVDVCREEVGRMTAAGLTNYDGFSLRFALVCSLIRGMASLYGARDNHPGRVLDGLLKGTDVLFEMVERQEVAA